MCFSVLYHLLLCCLFLLPQMLLPCFCFHICLLGFLVQFLMKYFHCILYIPFLLLFLALCLIMLKFAIHHLDYLYHILQCPCNTAVQYLAGSAALLLDYWFVYKHLPQPAFRPRSDITGTAPSFSHGSVHPPAAFFQNTPSAYP